MPEANYRYTTKGSNWAWGRNKTEQKVWVALVIVALVFFVLGASGGTYLGLKLWEAFSQYDMGNWPIVWTILLALIVGIGLMAVAVFIAYRIAWPVVEVIMAQRLSDKSTSK